MQKKCFLRKFGVTDFLRQGDEQCVGLIQWEQACM